MNAAEGHRTWIECEQVGGVARWLDYATKALAVLAALVWVLAIIATAVRL